MRLMMKHIGVAFVLGMLLTSCYGYRQVGLLQERDNLPQYDSVAYTPTFRGGTY